MMPKELLVSSHMHAHMLHQGPPHMAKICHRPKASAKG